MLWIRYNKIMQKGVQMELKRVVVALRTGYQDQSDRFDGIMSWVLQHNCWEVKLVRDKMDSDVLEHALEWGAQGMIVSNQLSPRALAMLADIDMPLITMDMREPGALKERKTNIIDLVTDSKEVARLAAEYFLQKLDYPNYAFIGASSEWEWSRIREREFVAALKTSGRNCAVYTMDVDFAVAGDQRDLARWIHDLSKPLALFVACDRCTHDVLELCHQEHIRIPEEIAVLSVDNEVMICTRTHPTLTSIQPDFEAGGYQAADLLNRMLNAESTERRRVLVPVKRIVERGSTAPCCMAGRMVQRACEFIEANACEGIGVEDVAHYLNVSRSLADLRFRQVKGQSILSVIQTVRLEHVARLLRTTTLPIKDIGELCGFGNENYLKQRFKKSFGLTMREYRKNAPCNSAVLRNNRTVKSL